MICGPRHVVFIKICIDQMQRRIKKGCNLPVVILRLKRMHHVIRKFFVVHVLHLMPILVNYRHTRKLTLTVVIALLVSHLDEESMDQNKDPEIHPLFHQV